jgi:uncharacterized protein YuzE
MPKFEFDYDLGNDSLFIFKKGSKSKGSIELGNFIYDFDSENNLTGIEILSAKEILAELVNYDVTEKMLENIKEVDVKIRIVSNLLMIKIRMAFNPQIFEKDLIAPVQVPNTISFSPATA